MDCKISKKGTMNSMENKILKAALIGVGNMGKKYVQMIV